MEVINLPIRNIKNFRDIRQGMFGFISFVTFFKKPLKLKINEFINRVTVQRI